MRAARRSRPAVQCTRPWFDSLVMLPNTMHMTPLDDRHTLDSATQRAPRRTRKRTSAKPDRFHGTTSALCRSITKQMAPVDRARPNRRERGARAWRWILARKTPARCTTHSNEVPGDHARAPSTNCARIAASLAAALCTTAPPRRQGRTVRAAGRRRRASRMPVVGAHRPSECCRIRFFCGFGIQTNK